MKVKIISTYPKQTFEFDDVWFSGDTHINHSAVIKFGRKFDDVEQMNKHIIDEINKKCGENDLLVLCGDTMMGEKDYLGFVNSLVCENIILLIGNHCSRSKLFAAQIDSSNNKIIYVGDYLELNIEKQIICCSHYPMFNWNFQEEGSINIHGHLHADENEVVKEIHKYKSMDVGIDNYYKLFGEYSVFSYEQVLDLMGDKKIIGRHENK